MLFGYALVTGVVVGGHLLVSHLQRQAALRQPAIDRLDMDDDPQSVWTVEMNAYAAQVSQHARPAPAICGGQGQKLRSHLGDGQ